jgi:hypothetical protein
MIEREASAAAAAATTAAAIARIAEYNNVVNI